MRILLTNDDGIDAPGIVALERALQGLGELLVVAPKTVQSATGHGVTLDRPLMAEEVAPGRISVDGRPADCVKVALRAIWPARFGAGTRPDLTVSGMNAGANVGINVIYSGTVAAAIESAFLGVPAIAVSLHLNKVASSGPAPGAAGYGATHFDRAADIARTVIDRVLEHELDPHGVVNINVPHTESADAPMPPVRVVEMNTAAGTDGYEERQSPWGKTYYWPSGSAMEFAHTRQGTDVEAIFERCVTVTPLSYELTDFARIHSWRERLETSAPVE